MSGRYTPGPWKLGRLGRYVYGGDDLAVVYVDDNATPREENEMQANARLIAAAPELLAMLTEAAEFIQPFNRAEELLDRIDVVIAKARGAS